MFSFIMTTRFDLAAVADALSAAPAWAKLGLAAPGANLRERAIERLASFIVERVEEPGGTVSDADQLTLAL